MSFSTHTLDNGLRLVFEEIPRIRSAAAGFLANTGSRDEPEKLAGVSHFLEHMCFKGTAKRDWRQLSLDVDNRGAMWNACSFMLQTNRRLVWMRFGPLWVRRLPTMIGR